MKNAPQYGPGVYVGKRFVWPGAHHEYIAVVPEDEKRLKRNVRKHVTEIGPNGERGYIVSAGVKRNKRNWVPGKKFSRGTMTGGTNTSVADLKAMKTGKAGRGQRKLNVRGKDIEKVGSRIHEKGIAHGDAKYYPELIDNWGIKKRKKEKEKKGAYRNSNTYVRSVLRDSGVKSKRQKLTPGSEYRYAKTDKGRAIEKAKELERLRNNLEAIEETLDFAVAPLYSNPYDKTPPKGGWNRQEKVAADVIKATPYLRGGLNGAIIGASTGTGIAGGLAGAGIGAVTQKALSNAGKEQVGDRKPLNGMVVAGALPTVALLAVTQRKRLARLGNWVKKGGPKIEKQVRNAGSSVADRAGPHTLGLESLLDDAIEFSRVMGPREARLMKTRGQYNKDRAKEHALEKRFGLARSRPPLGADRNGEWIVPTPVARRWAKREDSEAIRRS